MIKAIFQGYRNQQKKFARIRKKLIDGVRDELKIEIPEDLMSLIVSYLPEYYTSKESRALIKEAEQKFNEEQQSQSDPDEGQPLVQNMIGNITDMDDADGLLPESLSNIGIENLGTDNQVFNDRVGRSRY